MHRAARAAVASDLESLVAIEGRFGLKPIQAVGPEGEERRLGPRVVPVGVVVGGRLANVAQCRDDVRRVLPQVVELGLRVVHLLDQSRERRLSEARA